jgi:hypothetical protein
LGKGNEVIIHHKDELKVLKADVISHNLLVMNKNTGYGLFYPVKGEDRDGDGDSDAESVVYGRTSKRTVATRIITTRIFCDSESIRIGRLEEVRED